MLSLLGALLVQFLIGKYYIRVVESATKRERGLRNRSAPPRGMVKWYIDRALSPPGVCLSIPALLAEFLGGEC